MNKEDNIERFTVAQSVNYKNALSEIKAGKKQTHWMWYIFPQIAGLGTSEMAKRYAIKDVQEATAYFAHPILGRRLIEMSTAMLEIEGKTALQVLGSPDNMKLQSCMTLFNSLKPTHEIFAKVLDKYYNGVQDARTLDMLKGI